MSSSDLAILNRILEYQSKLKITTNELKNEKIDYKISIIEDSISFSVIQICELYEKLSKEVQADLDFINHMYYKRVRNRMVHNYGAIDMVFIKAFAKKLSSESAIKKVIEIKQDKKILKAKQPEITL